jgi:branched-chain amino acid transport system ATP-binding protein
MVALLELEAVDKAFGSVVVADALSLSLGPGEALGVVGPNGAGKTSMLNLITGIVAVDSGRIRLEGRDITGEPAHARARAGIGRTHQIPRPFGDMTVFENVLLGALYAGSTRPDGDAAAASVQAIGEAGLLSHANAMAGSLPLLGRKRLELARALATQPRVLLLDEVTGGVDQRSIPGLVQLVRDLHAGGLTLLVIEHNMRVITAMAQRIIALYLGDVIADGTPDVVARDRAVVEAYLGQAYTQ